MAPSFDISPKKRRVEAPRTRPPEVRPVRSAGVPSKPIASRSPSPRIQSRERSGRGVVPLRIRRRTARKRMLGKITLLLALLAVFLLVALWQSPLRIQTIEAEGIHADDMQEFVASSLKGTTYGILPSNSVFFLSRENLRSRILENYPDIEAVSISPTGFTSLSIATIGRSSSFLWCGTTYGSPPESCYDADETGKIFRTADTPGVPTDVASTSEGRSPALPTAHPISVFGAYQGGNETSPTGGAINNASYLPNLFRFVKALKELGANVTAVQLREDEADLYTLQGTRITYVLGREQDSLTLATTAFPTLDVKGFSLSYIDLRFSSKVYFKKRETVDAKKTSE